MNNITIMKTVTIMHTNQHLLLLLIGFLVIGACQDSEHEGHTHGEASHAHDPDEAMQLDTTIRRGAVELFLEYDPLIAGQKSDFSAHFTKLDGHAPIERGTVTASLIKGRQGIRHRVDTPSSPGLFKPALLPKQAGQYSLRFDIQSPDLSWNQFIEWPVRVFPDGATARKRLESRPPPQGDIEFSKERAWANDFQTVKVHRDTIHSTLKIPGRWMPSPKTERTKTAGTEGNVVFVADDLVEGKRVRRGQTLLLISGEALNSRSIQSDIEQAKAELDQVKKEYERKKELHDMQVVPASEFEEVEKRYEIVRSKYNRLIKNYSAGGVQVKAPFHGYIKKLHVGNGDFAGLGMPLFTVGSDRSNMIKAQIDPEHRDEIRNAHAIYIPYKKDGKDQLTEGRIESIGQQVSREEPMLPVFIKTENKIHAVEGSFTEVELTYGSGQDAIVIPRSALLEDFGTYKIAVQESGERYSIRPVKIGTRNARAVEITDGLKQGEWIVSKGAYQVKMASMEGSVPGHGHSH